MTRMSGEADRRARAYRSHEIAIVDENSSYLGVERRLLMENAGAAVARAVRRVVTDLARAKVLVVAGPGNNGGDAFVVARHLSGHVARMSVILLTGPEQIRTEEARSNWEALRRMKRKVEIHVAPSPEALSTLLNLFHESDIIVDGIFGTGIKGEVREPYKTAINLINSSKTQIFSIDVPSGVDPDTGEYSLAVRPHVTITLHGRKPFMDVLADKAGQVYVEEIGAPPEAELIAGPGDLKHSLSRLLRPTAAAVWGEGESVDGVVDCLRLFGVEPVVKSKKGGFALRVDNFLVSDGGEELAGAQLLVRPFGSPKVSDAISLSRRLQIPVYLVGGEDAISDGVYAKSNWLEPPVDSEYVFGVVAALSAVYLRSGVEPIYGLGAACFSARNPLRDGGASDKTTYLSRLARFVSLR